MGGIAGIFDPKRRVREPMTLKKMCEALKHRGPDYEGYFFDENVSFGHAGSEVLDGKTVRQPIHNEDETVWMTCDGEVYDSKTLEKELLEKGHKFYTRTDVEKIIHLYEENGIDFVKKLNGMFAFALYDKNRLTLLLVRDRVGMKPLYYTLTDSRLVFASEIKSILQVPGIKKEVNIEAVADYFTFENMLGNKTLFKGVKQLLPGHLLSADEEVFKITKYWDLPSPDPLLTHTEKYYVREFRSLIEKSVKMRIVGDAPLGSTLSGGIDSSINVITASAQLKNPLKTFMIAFPGIQPRFDETEYARIVAEFAKTEHHEILPTPDDFIAALPNFIWHVDEPRVGSGAIAQYILSKFAKKHVRVLLIGEGGDELFAGYDSFLAAYSDQCLKNFLKMCQRERLSEAIQILLKLSEKAGIQAVIRSLIRTMMPRNVRLSRLKHRERKIIRKLFSKNLQDKIGYYSPVCTLETIARKWRPLGPFFELYYTLFKVSLPSLLIMDDKTYLAHSVETRFPFLDNDLIELAASIPPHLKVKGLSTKYIPKKAMKNELPEKIITHKKTGFSIPIKSWFRQELKNFIFEILMDSKTINRGYFDQKYIERIIREHVDGKRDHSEMIWSLINFELWHRIFIDPENLREPV